MVVAYFPFFPLFKLKEHYKIDVIMKGKFFQIILNIFLMFEKYNFLIFAGKSDWLSGSLEVLQSEQCVCPVDGGNQYGW